VLLGKETSEYLNREPESERLLLEAERNLIAGGKRIHQLKAHGSARLNLARIASDRDTQSRFVSIARHYWTAMRVLRYRHRLLTPDT
jgi:hypothetical protein